MTLTEFLLARIAEDEAVANGMDVRVDGSKTTLDSRTTVASDGLTYAGMWACRFPAARVLAECEAKRGIVDLHSGGHECPGVGQFWCDDRDEWTQACPTLRIAALPYADHPDYDETWRP